MLVDLEKEIERTLQTERLEDVPGWLVVVGEMVGWHSSHWSIGSFAMIFKSWRLALAVYVEIMFP